MSHRIDKVIDSSILTIYGGNSIDNVSYGIN